MIHCLLLNRQTAVGINVIAAAQAAITQFRDPIHQNHPKAFIVTVNPLPLSQATPAQYFTLGLQKIIVTRFIANAADAYLADRIKFKSLHFFRRREATFRQKSHRRVVRHMRRYSGGLIYDEQQGDWDYRQVFWVTSFPLRNSFFWFHPMI